MYNRGKGTSFSENLHCMAELTGLSRTSKDSSGYLLNTNVHASSHAIPVAVLGKSEQICLIMRCSIRHERMVSTARTCIHGNNNVTLEHPTAKTGCYR